MPTNATAEEESDALDHLDARDRTTCKHAAAARFATGARAIPAPVTPADVRDDLATHVDAMPTFAGDSEPVTAPSPAAPATPAPPAVATDGGQVVELGADVDAGRPDDCECHPDAAADALPCFACWRAGFDAPNPDAPAEDTDR